MNQELMTLDFWQDTVIYEGKTFPIGTLACDALNVPVNTIAKINEQCEKINLLLGILNAGQDTSALFPMAKEAALTMLEIVEDDIGLNQGLSKALKADDRQIISCQDLKTAKEQLLCSGVSLILLDINLPDGSGLELLREIKENTPGIPVILLTANDTDLDIVDGLERGADDYITKPFSLSVLRARVNTQLRKQASNHKNAPIHINLFHFDFEAMTFYAGDSKVELSKTEQKLLRLLVENRGRTMTRGDLVDRIWTDGAEYVDENALSVTIKRLRDKLGAQKYIKTIYGIGYSWVTKDE